MKITEVLVRDIRFPTSYDLDGSDALNRGDYSATYVTLLTDSGLTRDGLTRSASLPSVRSSITLPAGASAIF